MSSHPFETRTTALVGLGGATTDGELPVALLMKPCIQALRGRRVEKSDLILSDRRTGRDAVRQDSSSDASALTVAARPWR